MFKSVVSFVIKFGLVDVIGKIKIDIVNYVFIYGIEMVFLVVGIFFVVVCVLVLFI